MNTCFLGLWTAFMVVTAVAGSTLKRDPGLFKRAQRFWARGLLRFWGVELRVVGADNVDPNRSYVVMANHLSYVDIVALFVALPVLPGFLAKKELTRVPFLAAALRHGGHVVIDRGSHNRAMAALDRAAQQVREGRTVLIFPEGTRGDSDTVGAFKGGGFRLARKAMVPILPVGLRGCRAVFPRRSLLIRPGVVEVHIGAPLAPEVAAELDFRELTDRVRGTVMKLSAMPARPVEDGGKIRSEPSSAAGTTGS